MDPLEVKNLMGIEWRFSEWIFQAGGLNPQNVLEYFSLSPFWDPNSNNAVLKMQTQYNALQSERIDLAQMVGIEFVLAYEKYPEAYVISKRRRLSQNKVINIAFYYIINGNIYQAPPLTDILSSRMQTSLNEIQDGFNEISSKVDYSPFKGYTWKSFEDQNNIKRKNEETINPSTTQQVAKSQFAISVDYMLNLGVSKQSIISQKTKMTNLGALESKLGHSGVSGKKSVLGTNLLDSGKSRSDRIFTPQLGEQGYSSELFTGGISTPSKMPPTPTPSLYVSQSNPHTPTTVSHKRQS